MNRNLHLVAAKLLLLAGALCLAPAAHAEDSKYCNWPNDAAQGLVCLVDQNTPLLPNGTTRDNPARICTHGPNPLDLLDDGCHELWYDRPGESDVLPVPWKRGDFEPFLLYLESKVNSGGKETGWCLADRLPPYKVRGREEETTDGEGNPVLAVTYKCEGHLKSCEAGAAPECVPGEDRVVYEPACDEDAWSPDTSTVEKGVLFTQTNECGEPRDAWGTKPVASLRWVVSRSEARLDWNGWPDWARGLRSIASGWVGKSCRIPGERRVTISSKPWTSNWGPWGIFRCGEWISSEGGVGNIGGYATCPRHQNTYRELVCRAAPMP